MSSKTIDHLAFIYPRKKGRSTSQAITETLLKAPEAEQLRESYDRALKVATIDAHFRSIDRFLGSLHDYNSFKSEEHEVLDTNRPQKSIQVGQSIVMMSPEEQQFFHKLYSAGCTGVIWYQPRCNERYVGTASEYGIGIPVRKKR